MRLNELIVGDVVTLCNGDRGTVVGSTRSTNEVLLSIKDREKDRFYPIRNHFSVEMEYTPNSQYSINEVERIQYMGGIAKYNKIWVRNGCTKHAQLMVELEEIQHSIDSLKLEISLMKRDVKDLKERRKEILQRLN